MSALRRRYGYALNYLRRGATTREVFDRATACTVVEHNWREGDQSRPCSVEQARKAFDEFKSARMSLREDDGAYVFVCKSHWGYTRYELTAPRIEIAPPVRRAGPPRKLELTEGMRAALKHFHPRAGTADFGGMSSWHSYGLMTIAVARGLVKRGLAEEIPTGNSREMRLKLTPEGERIRTELGGAS